jgi:hypothetical protein
MLAATALTWLCLGALLYLLRQGRINSSNALTVLGFFVVAFLYLNVLRERFRYGDYAYYLEAATALLENRALPDTYLYLPLWATLLQFFVPLGDQGVLLVLWVLNMVALGAFYFLLHGVLIRYGFTVRTAALIALLFVVINAPIQRTLGFVQVNLIVMDLVFLAMLQYPRRSWLSAACLALAIHLKTSPVVLVIAFLLERDRRWLAYFVASFLLLAGIPLLTDGLRPYQDFVRNNLALLQLADTNFHETSIDSFVRFTGMLLGLSQPIARTLVYVLKLVLAAAALVVVGRLIRQRTFVRRKGTGAVLLNALPPLFILMTLAPPIVLDHHGVFVTLPALLLLRVIPAPGAWAWYGLAYFLEFVLPSFDFYPWSFGRLLAPAIFLVLLWLASGRPTPRSQLARLDSWLAAAGPRGR